MLAIVIIPARYQSTRFPGKPLAKILNKPMIQHVYEKSVCARGIDMVYVATDDDRIYDTVKSFTDNVLMTSSKHETGTDRIAEAASIINSLTDDDIIINVQGDEPVVSPLMIESLVDAMKQDGHKMATIARQIQNHDDIENTNVVKVVFDKDYNALYFSRCPIPFNRKKGIYFKHIGIYAYNRSFLFRFTGLPKGVLEETECLEQLRALEHGYKIRIVLTDEDTIGVDTPQDIERVEKWIRNSSL
ncbi:MAG: 3-deoxy-manno-octulosonate cytidylyltransferase [Thermodesulfovibrionales bacterium]|nr:3-deoxy-manno-octulosonate cytidylyltransferase [Thermodesulfovibrionales bacterium]